MPTRNSRRKGITAFLMPDDVIRLKKIAAMFPTEMGKPNQTRAIEKALKFFEKSMEEKMPTKNKHVIVRGAGAATAKRIAKKLGISEDAAIRISLIFFLNSVNTPPPKRV